MKKYVLLIAALCFVLSGCGSANEVTLDSKDKDMNIIEETTTESVKDVIPPEISFNSEQIYSKTDSEIDYEKYYDIYDDIDEVSDIRIEVDDSNIDITKPGKYKLFVSAIDLSNNKTTAETYVYIYKDYTNDEISDIIKKLIDEKYYDFKVDDKSEEDDYYRLHDETYATDNPTGETQIWGYVDYLINLVGLNVDITTDDLGNKNQNISWNTDLVFDVVEITSYAEIHEIDQLEVVSKEGKLVFTQKDNLYDDWYISYDELPYISRGALFCFDSEDEIISFREIIKGDNPQIRLVSDTGETFSTIKLNENDINNYNSAIDLYNSLNEYICNIPKTESLSSPSDATSMDSDAENE